MTPNFTELIPQTGRLVDPVADITSESRPSHRARPWVFSNMISSLDGGTAVKGLSGRLGGAADAQVFRGLRASAQAIVVGATTAIAEQYRTAKPNAQGDRPTIIIISASLNVPEDLPVFTNPDSRPILATVTSAPASQVERLSRVAEVVAFGAERVDLNLLLADLARRGVERLLLEGGPRLNAQFVAADLIDEWNLTLSPILLAGDSTRTAAGPPDTENPTQSMDLVRLWQAEEFLFGRWVRHDEASS